MVCGAAWAAQACLPGGSGGSVAFAGLGREILLQLTGNTVKFLAVGGTIALHRDIGPFGRIFGVELEPGFEPRLGVGLDGVGGAFGLANAAIDTFVGVMTSMFSPS